MLRYIGKKAVIFLSSLFFVVTATFFLMRATPGDPFSQEQPIPQEILDALFSHYGLDRPWYVQYGRYLKGLATFDLGPSYKYEGRMVSDIIGDGLPVSMALGGEALFLALFFGISFGSIAALKQSEWQDRTMMILAVIGISMPSFIIATFLQYIFAMKLGVLPVARWGGFAHTILPALSLSAMPTAIIARLTRSSMVEVIKQDFILTAKAKGLTTFQIVRRHLFRNALLPVVSYLGSLTASILTGSFVIEKIFGIPGLGQWFVKGIMNRDYTTIMGMTVFYCMLLMSAVFVVDLIYPILDPRMRLNHGVGYE
jgi:oligopeptide transport system permease protein